MSKINTQLKNIVVPVLLGPTAVGKTVYALDLAQKNNWEILSCDSRQIYRYMSIGTAKPDLSQLNQVKHWLIDVKNPDELYSAYDFSRDALRIIYEQNALGKTILICGGTGLYYKVLSEGLCPGIETDPELKEELMKHGKNEGTESLYAELQHVDPDASISIHKNDLQRIVRALAVYKQTGILFSKVKQESKPPIGIKFKVIKLMADRDILYGKIDKRVVTMMENGLLDEFKSLCAMGFGKDSPGMKCVGYQEFFPYLNNEIDLTAAVSNIQRNSRRYAKRQCTWLAHQVYGLEIKTGDSLQILEDYYKSF